MARTPLSCATATRSAKTPTSSSFRGSRAPPRSGCRGERRRAVEGTVIRPRRLPRMMRAMRLLCVALALALVVMAVPRGARSEPITLGDVQGTGGQWQQGEAIVPAPPAVVQDWLTDYKRWQGRFPDIAWARALGDDERGRHIAEFHSALARRTFALPHALPPAL